MKKVFKNIEFKYYIYIFSMLVFYLIQEVFSRPYITINGSYPSKEKVYSKLYECSCEMSRIVLNDHGYFGGYNILDFPSLKEFCIKIEENGEIERSMQESNMFIRLEDPISSAQYIWTFARIKYNLYLFESDSFEIWRMVLIKLKLISSYSELEYKPEYDVTIRSRPVLNGPAMEVRIFPTLDDVLLMISLATLVYKKGKFATDFTKRNFFSSEKVNETMTPLLNSNIDYYIPILMKLYTPSFKYQDLITSVSFLYRLIFYCTGHIITPQEAWEIWGLVMSWGGGGFIPEYKYDYTDAILSQDPDDSFPEERNFLIVIERLSRLQNPSWDVTFPPIYNNNYENNVFYKFLISKGYPLLNKNIKDTDAIAIIYHTFHYILNIFISITTSRDIWMVLKRWLNISFDISLSSKIKFIQYNSNSFSRDIKLEKVGIFVERPRLATGASYIDVYSEIMLTYLSEFESEFPYVITCPEGELVLKNNANQDVYYHLSTQRNQKVDLFALNIAKEVHVLFPTVKFSDICELASSFALIVPFNFKLNSKFSENIFQNPEEENSNKEDTIEIDNSLKGIEYCRKGIINLLEESGIDLEDYDNFESLHINKYMDAACRRILKSQLKCNLDLPYYFPVDVTDTFNTFAGNLANAMSSSFIGKTHFYNEVIGTIWDGKIQSVVQESDIPSFYRLHNPKFNSESLCKFVQGFVNPAIINYFEEKKLLLKKKNFKNERQNIIKKIKKKYFSNKLEENLMETFHSDLISLKNIVNAHRIPKGADLKHWKDFFVDENTISSFIVRQFKKLSDFEAVCKVRLERFLRKGEIQFHPISRDVNIYREFLLNRKERSNLFFKKISKDDKLDPEIRGISNFLIFRHETPDEIPENIANHLMDSIIFEKSEQQFKNVILWYINDSCQKAYKLISEDLKHSENQKNTNNCFSSCTCSKNNSDEKDIEDQNNDLSRMDVVQEALEFGLKVALKNPLVNLNFSKLKIWESSLKDLELSGIRLYDNILEKDFILMNSNYLYFYMMRSFLPITEEAAFKATKIASLLLKNYYLHGEALLDNEIVYVATENNEYKNVGNFTIYNNISSIKNEDLILPNYCASEETSENTINLYKTLTMNGEYLVFNNYIMMDWKDAYLNKIDACEIVESLLKIRENEKSKSSSNYKNTLDCIKTITKKYQHWPHIVISVCESQEFLLDCQTNNHFQNLIASIIVSNLPKNKNFENLQEFGCYFSNYIQLFYKIPNFIDNCSNLFTENPEFSSFMDDLYLKSSKKNNKYILSKICTDLNFSNTCENNINNLNFKNDIERVANNIQQEIMNEMTDYNMIFKKNMFCEIAEKIVVSDMENCLTTLRDQLKLFNYDFPKNFERTICLKLNFWPRRCEKETFSNQSLFADYFYNEITRELQKESLLNNYKEVKNSYFTDICNIMESNYIRNRDLNNKDSIALKLGIKMNEICDDYFGQIFQNKVPDDFKNLLEKKEKCNSLISTFESINNDSLLVDIFDPSEDLFVENIPFLPNYMLEENLADKLINNFRLPPRLTLMSIALYSSLENLNYSEKLDKYKFSIIGVLYNSLKMILLDESMDPEQFYHECILINKERISPSPNDLELKDVCRNTMIAYENNQLKENIYLLYSLNIKVSSYYTSDFTSNNVRFIPKQYISKILRGRPSRTIQNIYEKILDTYATYMLNEGFVSSGEIIDDQDNILATYKRTRTDVINASSSKIIKERIGFFDKKNETDIIDNEHTELLDFLDKSTYKIKIGNKSKHKLIKSILMFNFLLEIKRLGALQIHSQALRSEMINELTFNSLLKYLPPDMANWLTTNNNYFYVDNFFVIPVELQENNALGSFENLDSENNILFESLSDMGIAIDRNIYMLSNRYKVLGENKNAVSPEILKSTIKFLINEKNKDITLNYSFEITNNSYLFRNSIKKIVPSSLNNINQYSKTKSIIFNKVNFTALKAIIFFFENNLELLRSKLDFRWLDLNISEKFHPDSLYYYRGKLDSEEMNNTRRRIFCQIFNEQITQNIDIGKNPFFECNYYHIQNDIYKEVHKNQQGKTLKICSFTGKATRARKMGTEKVKNLMNEYLKYLIHNIDDPFLTSESIKLAPELILRAIGRIYGHCLLHGEPINLNFHNLIFMHLTGVETNNEFSIKNIFDSRIYTYQKIISISYGGVDAKKYSVPRMSFENAKKRILNNEPIYYNIPDTDYQVHNEDLLKKQNSFFEVKNFNNLRFLKRNITRFVTFEKFQVEIDSFITGVLDIVPRRFLRTFSQNNLFFYTQGYNNPLVKNVSLVKNYLNSFFYVENEELLLPHKRQLIQLFLVALNNFSYTDIGFFFSIFSNQFSVILPTAYVGRIRIVEIPLDNEKNVSQRIIIDPLLTTIYVPNYKSFEDFEINIRKVIEMNKKKFQILN